MRRYLAQYQKPPDNVIVQLMALMFFSSVGRGIVSPYVSLYLSQVGATGAVIGTIVAISSLVELILSPILNNYADKHNRHRLLLITQYSVFSIGAFLLAFTQDIVLLAGVIVLIELGKRSAIVLSMQLTLTRLEQLNRDILGRVRSFNAIGFSLANLSQGVIFLLTGFTGMFVTGSLFVGSTLFFIRVLPKQISTRKINQQVAPRQRKFYILVLIQILVQLGLRSGFTFWLIHFTNNMGIYIEDVGIIVGISALAEVPFFIMFDSMVRRLDVRITYMLGASGMGLMWFLIAIAPTPIWILPILVLRGFAFALLSLSILILIARISDPRNVATNQSLLQVTVPGLATLFGAPLMGWIYDQYVAWIYFGLCMLLMMAGSLIMLIAYRTMEPTLIEAHS